MRRLRPPEIHSQTYRQEPFFNPHTILYPIRHAVGMKWAVFFYAIKRYEPLRQGSRESLGKADLPATSGNRNGWQSRGREWFFPPHSSRNIPALSDRPSISRTALKGMYADTTATKQLSRPGTEV